MFERLLEQEVMQGEVPGLLLGWTDDAVVTCTSQLGLDERSSEQLLTVDGSRPLGTI